MRKSWKTGNETISNHYFHRMKKLTVSFVIFFTAVAGFSAFQGCSKDPLGAVKVTGTVTLDGKPEEGVSVAFCPQGDGGRECFGVTDAGGKFVLTIAGAQTGSGAIPGEYGIELKKIQKEKVVPGAPMAAPPFPPPPPVHLIPAQYASRATTDIAPVKVEKGKKNVFQFEMKSSQ